MDKKIRQQMDLDLQKHRGISEIYKSHPFTKGQFQPGRINAEDRWKPKGDNRAANEEDTPKLVLRDTKDVLTQSSVSRLSSWKILPGTTRNKRFQDVQMLEVEEVH